MKKKLLFCTMVFPLWIMAQNATYAHDPYIRIKKGQNLFFDQLNLKVDSTQLHLQVTISNLLGQTIQAFKILRNLSFVPTSTIKPGYYILRISSGEHITTKKIVITA